MADNRTVNINLDKMPDFVCPKCRSKRGTFNKNYRLKFVPGIMIGSPKPVTVAIEQHACCNCGYAFTQQDVAEFKIPTDEQEKTGSDY